MTLVEPFYMNAEQLQKTLVASQYAEQVLNLPVLGMVPYFEDQ